MSFTKLSTVFTIVMYPHTCSVTDFLFPLADAGLSASSDAGDADRRWCGGETRTKPQLLALCRKVYELSQKERVPLKDKQTLHHILQEGIQGLLEVLWRNGQATEDKRLSIVDSSGGQTPSRRHLTSQTCRKGRLPKTGRQQVVKDKTMASICST